MCTVSFIAKRDGYALAMNRDEKLTRAAGLPPVLMKLKGRKVLCPSESSGGTWIAVNESGASFALINWYAIKTRVGTAAASRGQVVVAVAPLDRLNSVAAALVKFPLEKVNPFRLVGIFPEARQIIEWRWNLENLVEVKHDWIPRQWISSGFNEPEAQRVRSRTFRRALRQSSAGKLEWLRRLHRSHGPRSGPFSICMHRADAATVSYTEIRVSPREARMLFSAGEPCQAMARLLGRLAVKK